MNTFDISLLDDEENKKRLKELMLSDTVDEKSGMQNWCGQICIGHFKETFISILGYWNKSNYQQQWCEAAHFVLTHNKPTGFVVAVTDPKLSTMLRWWPIYPLENEIHIQEHLLIFKQLSVPFNINKLYDYVPERKIVNEDGDKISEWVISKVAFEKWHKLNCRPSSK